FGVVVCFFVVLLFVLVLVEGSCVLGVFSVVWLGRSLWVWLFGGVFVVLFVVCCGEVVCIFVGFVVVVGSIVFFGFVIYDCVGFFLDSFFFV
ncbi:hypothetical protein, partial [Salinicoccus roseus]|uniref:hypothetical protein n=1 Tax=Salinicoccus roseus TaxID=45670 RepID=UPI003565ADD3